MTSSNTFPPQQRRAGFAKGVTHRALPIALLAFCPLSCAGALVESEPANIADAESAYVLADVIDSAETPCSMRMPSAPRDAPVSPPQVFVEAILIELPSGANWRLEPGSISTLARIPGAKQIATPHLIATLETAQTMDLGRHFLPPDATLEPGIYFNGITILPRRGDAGALVLDVDVALHTSESRQAAAAAPAEMHVRNTFVVREKSVSWLAVPVPGYSKATLLLGVKPHLVSDQADLRNIFECKMQQRQRSLSRRQSGR